MHFFGLVVCCCSILTELCDFPQETLTLHTEAQDQWTHSVTQP